ncbi:MAG: sensor histidine kinase, partial [Thermoanaerobaculia bacterium]
YDRAENAQSEADIEVLSRRLSALKSVTLAVSKSLDSASIAAALRRELERHFGVASGAICTIDENGTHTRLEVWGLDEATIAEIARNSDDDTGAVRIVGAAGRTWLRAVLRNAERDIGALILSTAAETAGDDLELVRAIASEAAIALSNAQLNEETRRAQARTQELSRRIVAVQEEERRLLGRELHDQLGQMLTGLRLTLASFAAEHPAGHPLLAEARTLADEMVERVHALSLTLRPPMLDDGGLVAALSWHLARFQNQTGISVDFRHRDVEDIDTEIAIGAFRIIQEALTNVARHADARNVRVRVWTSEDQLLVNIADDGRGFDKSPRPDSLGISGMHERAVLLGGIATVMSALGEGTTVTIALPVRNPEPRR